MHELKTLTGRRVVIALDSATLRGIIASATRRFVTLYNVEDVGRPDPAAVAGSVLIPVNRVIYVQVVE